MGIMGGASVMRGRRLLPGVKEPLTSFGDNLKVVWDVPLSSTLYKTALSPDEKFLYVVGADATILKVATPTGEGDVLVDDPYTFCQQVAVDPNTGDLYGVSNYRRIRWDSNTGARIAQQLKSSTAGMRFGFWVGDGLWIRGVNFECVGTDLAIRWTRSPGPVSGDSVAGIPVLVYKDDSIVEVVDPLTGLTASSFSLGRVINNTGPGTSYSSVIAACQHRIAAVAGLSEDKTVGVYDLDGSVVWVRENITALSDVFNQRSNGMAVACDRFGDVYVVLSLRNGEVLKFDGKNGDLVWRSSDQGIVLDGRSDCRSLVLDAQGSMYLTFQNGTAMKITQT